MELIPSPKMYCAAIGTSVTSIQPPPPMSIPQKPIVCVRRHVSGSFIVHGKRNPATWLGGISLMTNANPINKPAIRRINSAIFISCPANDRIPIIPCKPIIYAVNSPALSAICGRTRGSVKRIEIIPSTTTNINAIAGIVQTYALVDCQPSTWPALFQ
jgi:hypothetical protein